MAKHSFPSHAALAVLTHVHLFFLLSSATVPALQSCFPSASNQTQDQTPALDMHYTELREQLRRCQWDHVVVFFDKDHFRELHTKFFQFLVELSIPFTVYRIHKSDFKTTFHVEYVKKRRKNFVLMTDVNRALVKKAQVLSLSLSRDVMAAVPHRSRWLLLEHSSVSRQRKVFWMKYKCVLDHVASVSVDGEFMTSIQTLMWRGQRQREWESLHEKHLHSGCAFFPNLNNNLNGRVLVAAVRNITPGILISKEGNGTVRYSGLYIDIGRELQTLMNFSVTYHHWSPSWQDFSTMVYNQTVDIGLVYFSQNSAMGDGNKGIYPITFDDIGAAYVYNSSVDAAEFGYLSSATDLILGLIVATFVFVIIFYQILLHIFMAIRTDTYNEKTTVAVESGKTKNTKLKEGLHTNKIMHEESNYDDFNKTFRYEDTGNRKSSNELKTNNVKGIHVIDINVATRRQRKHPFLYNFLRFCDYVCRNRPNIFIMEFYGSYLNQGSLIRPNATPLRIFLFSWCMFVLMFSSLLIGTLTAGFVKPIFKPPMTTMTEVLQSDRIELGSFEETEVHSRSKYWTVNHRLWEGRLTNFPVTLTTSPHDFRKFMEEHTAKPRVFVYYKSMLEYLKLHSNFQSLYITEDNYQQALLGFVVSRNSDIEPILSRSVARLHETGIMEKISRRYMNNIAASETSTDMDPAQENVTGISYYQKFFYLIAFLVWVSFIVLGLEILVQYLQVYFNHQRRNHLST